MQFRGMTKGYFGIARRKESEHSLTLISAFPVHANTQEYLRSPQTLYCRGIVS